MSRPLLADAAPVVAVAKAEPEVRLLVGMVEPVEPVFR
jgi:hypothetical protein